MKANTLLAYCMAMYLALVNNLTVQNINVSSKMKLKEKQWAVMNTLVLSCYMARGQ
jgi:hypothetical protein